MTYRVVKIEPCEWAEPCRVQFAPDVCQGCRGDGTRMVDVAVVEQQERHRVDWSSGNPVPVVQAVWVEVES